MLVSPENSSDHVSQTGQTLIDGCHLLEPLSLHLTLISSFATSQIDKIESPIQGRGAVLLEGFNLQLINTVAS